MPDNVDAALAEGWPLSVDTIELTRRADGLEADIAAANKRMASASRKPAADGEAAPKRRRKSTLANPAGEDLMQINLMAWAHRPDTLASYPELAYIWHTPNGGGRSALEGAMMKRLGALAGVLDLTLPVPRGGYHGYYLELKVKPNDLTESQKKMVAFLESQGYYVAVIYDYWAYASDDIQAYLCGERIRPGSIIVKDTK